MGADIHMYIEYQPYGPDYWSPFGGRINPGRDYTLFGLLAGVRSSDDPVFPLRGLPENLGWEARSDNRLYISDEPGEGYVTLEKAHEYTKWGSTLILDASGDPTWVTHPDWHSHSWLTTAELEQVLKHIEYGVDVGYQAVLAAMKVLPNARVVFWFDN